MLEALLRQFAQLDRLAEADADFWPRYRREVELKILAGQLREAKDRDRKAEETRRLARYPEQSPEGSDEEIPKRPEVRRLITWQERRLARITGVLAGMRRTRLEEEAERMSRQLREGAKPA